jgi:hypothetical protein
MYSITENIYYSQLSSVAILLQPEPNCFTSYSTRIGFCLLMCYRLAVFLSSHVSACNGQRNSQLFCVHYGCRTVLCGNRSVLRRKRYTDRNAWT